MTPVAYTQTPAIGAPVAPAPTVPEITPSNGAPQAGTVAAVAKAVTQQTSGTESGTKPAGHQ